MSKNSEPNDTIRLNWRGLLIKLGALLFLMLGAIWGIDHLQATFSDASDGTKMMLSIGILATYALLIAIPFVPGIELGIGLLLVKGADAAPGVYIATVAGLCIAFTVGRFVPFRWLHSFAVDLGAPGLARRIEQFHDLPLAERLSTLQSRLPNSLTWLAGRFRYVLLAGLINLPGSAVLGGGGGILMIAGLSRLFAWKWAYVTIALSVLPIPLVVWVFGEQAVSFFNR